VAPPTRMMSSRQPSKRKHVKKEESDDEEDDCPKPIRNRRPSIASNASMNSCMNQFELLPVWTNHKKRSKKRSKMGKLSRTCSFESLSSVESMDMSVPVKPRCAYPILDPNSAKRATWDVTATILVFYDMVAIPLLLFELPSNWFSYGMEWSTRFFWTLDIFMSFITGNLKPDGSIEMRRLKIARTYLMSWFPIDILIVGSDWMEVFWSDGSFLGFARAGKASRTFRIIRMVRLFRLARVRTAYTMLLDRLKSEQLVIIAGIINIMLVIVGLGHVIACGFYGIAVQDREDTWLRRHEMWEASFQYKYSTALHWSLLQFAGGTDEIHPHNTDERIYAIGVFLLAFVMAAVFVGRLTSSMTQLHMLSRKDVERFQTLRRYLHKNEISGILMMRVMHNAQHALAETQRFMEESRVELLSIISEPLRVELHFELYSPVLAVHPFFRCFIDACPQVMKKVCHKAMSQLLVSNGDIVFMPGEVPSPPRMIVVCSGELSYTYVTGAIAYVQAGQWLSEAVLWVPWTHQGMLKATKDCRLCILDAHKFFQITENFDHDFDVRTYAKAFVNCMNCGEIDASDLPFTEDCDEIMEVIDRMSVTREEGGGHAGREDGWGPTQSPVNSVAPSEDSYPVSPLPKKSVLMVTPNYPNESRGGWW